MNTRTSIYRKISIAIMFLGILFLILDIWRGDASAGLFLIIPFVVVSGPFSTLGILLLIGGFVLYQFSIVDDLVSRFPQEDGTDHTMRRPQPSSNVERRTHGGGIIFLGPIPIIFGDNSSIRYLVPVAIALLILILLAGRFF